MEAEAGRAKAKCQGARVDAYVADTRRSWGPRGEASDRAGSSARLACDPGPPCRPSGERERVTPRVQASARAH